MRWLHYFFGAVVLTTLSGCVTPAQENVPPWADVHVHISGKPDSVPASVADLIRAMDDDGIRTAVIMPIPQDRPRFPYTIFAGELRRFPDRFRFLGGGGSLNPMIQYAVRLGTVPPRLRQRFDRMAERILADGAVGFGEITALHLSLAPNHTYERAPVDHPLLLRLADIAAEHDVVVDFHLDLVIEPVEPLPEKLAKQSKNPRRLEPNLAEFERLLAHNRRAKIVWAHAGSDFVGQWTPAISRTLFARHPNLYMSIRIPPRDGSVVENIFPGGRIDADWLALLREFPDRFVLGGDQFFSHGVPDSAPIVRFAGAAQETRAATRRFLAALPPELVRKIAFDNAARLYRFPRQGPGATGGATH